MTECVILSKDEFEAIMSGIQAIKTKLGIDDHVLKIKDLAQRYQCSYNYLKYTAPYLMPNNGKSEFDGVIKWTLETVEAWEKIPLAERKQNWENEKREEAKALIKERSK